MKTKNFFGVFLVVSAAIFIPACYKNKNAYNSPNAIIRFILLLQETVVLIVVI